MFESSHTRDKCMKILRQRLKKKKEENDFEDATKYDSNGFMFIIRYKSITLSIGLKHNNMYAL